MGQTSSKKAMETVEPLGERVLIRKDEDKKRTKGGIELPGNIEIPPIRQYDKVLFNPKNAVPVDFEGDNRLFVVPVDDVVAVFRRSNDD